MSKHYKKFVAIASSNSVFWIIIVIFILESIWFALSLKYPITFSELIHFTSIKIYSEQYSPIFIKPSSSPLASEPLVHSTSFLFNYLMSFPYRYISIFTNSQSLQILFLRFINIAFFTWGIIIFRRLLLKVRDEPALINLSIFFFILIPVVPFLAGQINDQSLGLVFSSLALLWTVRFVEQLRTKQQLNISQLVGAISFAVLSSLVSILFLPILAGIVLYIVYVVLRFIDAKPKNFQKAFIYNWRRLNATTKSILFIFLFISFGLFIVSYGVNLVKYHSLSPSCNQALIVNNCQTTLNINPNYNYTSPTLITNRGVVSYTTSWIKNMSSSMVTLNFLYNGQSSTIPSILIVPIIITVGGLVLFVIYGIEILRHNPYLKFLLLIDLVFIISLWAENYYSFTESTQINDINGVYLIPVLIPIMFMIGLCYKRLLGTYKKP